MKLLEQLDKDGILDALRRIDFPVEEMFSNLNENSDMLYSSYSWEKSVCQIDCVDEHYVINAIPKDFSKLAWEEWYKSNGKLVHHILCEKKWAECTDETFIPADDVNHPSAIVDKKWFYFEDEDIRPYFARFNFIQV